MANKPKIGLDYFPLEVNFFSDIKTRKLVKYQGGKAISVYTYLLCIIYQDGYYMKWDKELPFVISESTGFDEAYVQEALKCCMDVGLLSKKMYEENGILTSKGIQERYEEVCRIAKRKAKVSEYSLIHSEDIRNPSEGLGKTPEESTQSKVKESKVKKSTTGYAEFVEFWNEVNQCSLRVTEKKRKQIASRLKTFSEQEIKQAITNRSQDSWINGEGSKFKTDWNSFWRNDEKVETWLNRQKQEEKFEFSL